MTLPDLRSTYSPISSPKSNKFPLDLLLALSNLQNKEKAFLKQSLPTSLYKIQDYKQSYKKLLTSTQNNLNPLKSFPHPQPELTKKYKSLKSEVYKQTLEISKLKSDNKLLKFELVSVQNELKVQKSQNQTASKTELFAKKNELLSKLKSKSQELDRKKILALEIQKELSLLQVSNQNLKNYLYEMRKMFGNLDIKAKNFDLTPILRKNRSQDFKSK